MPKEDKIKSLQAMISKCEEAPLCYDASSHILEPHQKTQSPIFEKASNGEEKAYQRLLKILSYSDRCEFELRKKLADASFTEDEIDCAIEKAKRLNFVNDHRFGVSYVESQLRLGKGVVGIRRDLLAKGFDQVSIDNFFFESEENVPSEYDRALDFLGKHTVTAKNVRDGAFRKLIRKGFSVSVASEAAKIYADQRNS